MFSGAFPRPAGCVRLFRIRPMQEPMFTVVRSSIQSADGQARTGAGWCANRLTRGRCASKISIRLTFRGRSTWPTRSGSRTIRIIILRTSRERREKVRPCYRGLFCAAGADTTSHYTTEGATAANHTTSAVMRIANMVAPNVSRFQVRPWMRKSRAWSLRHWSRIASQWRSRALAQLEREAAALERQWKLRVERVRYEASRAQRQYEACEPLCGLPGYVASGFYPQSTANIRFIRTPHNSIH